MNADSSIGNSPIWPISFLSLIGKPSNSLDSEMRQPPPRIQNPMDLFIPNYSSHIRNDIIFLSAPKMHSPSRLFSRIAGIRDRRRSSMTSPSRPSSPVLLDVHLTKRDAQLDRLTAISPSLGNLRAPTPSNCFAASVSMVTIHDQMDDFNGPTLSHSTGYHADDDGDGDASPLNIFLEQRFAQHGDGDDRNQTSDKKRRASSEQEPGPSGDATSNSHASAPTDDANPRKKRKVKSPQTQTTALASSETVSSAAAVLPRPTATAQGGRRTSATGSATSQTPNERSSAQPPTGRPALASQSTRPPQPLQMARPAQSSPVARTGQLKKSSHVPPAVSSTTTTPAEDVVIADVDPAPSPKVAIARVQSVGTSATALVNDKSKKLGKRPPPLANVPGGPAGNGSTQHPSWQSSGSGSTASHVDVEGLKTGLPSATVSPVISGFPMHNADKATLESFRHAQQIKDQQRDLILKRRQGRAPLTMDSPGIGPPPSAGVIPPMMYLHKNSVGSRRSEAVKQKVQGMRVSTSSEGYGRQNGLKTAPVGQSRQAQQPAHAAQSSHMRTTAHPDDGQDEDELMQDDVPMQHGNAPFMESGYAFSSQRPSQPPLSARHLPQTAHPSLGGYPQSYAAPRYVDGDYPDGALESERRRSLNGYAPPAVGTSRARSPPAYPPGTAYGHTQPGTYPPRLPANGPPTAGLARGEYPPGTMYRPRQVSGYPSVNGAGASARARSPGGRPISGYANGSFDVNKEHFMEPFHLLYDAFIDSMHLKKDLESKIRRANDLVEAQEAELRRIAGLRAEFERTLDKLQKDQDRLSQQPPTRPREHRGNTSPPPSGGSDGNRALTAPQGDLSERDREVAEMRLKLQQMERQPR